MISEDEVKALYKKHDLKPRAGSISAFEGACCALGVIALDKGVRVGTTDDASVAVGLSISEGWMFALGFDAGFRKYEIDHPHDSFYLQGHKIGVACRDLL